MSTNILTYTAFPRKIGILTIFVVYFILVNTSNEKHSAIRCLHCRRELRFLTVPQFGSDSEIAPTEECRIISILHYNKVNYR
jgi:hypothetical protein